MKQFFALLLASGFLLLNGGMVFAASGDYGSDEYNAALEARNKEADTTIVKYGSDEYLKAQEARNKETNASNQPAAQSSSDIDSNCSGENVDIKSCLSSAERKYKNIVTLKDYEATGGLKDKVVSLTNRIISIVALLAIAAIVASGFYMVTAYGSDEKIKQGKNSLKFGIIGLVIALISFPIVNAIINFFYDIGG